MRDDTEPSTDDVRTATVGESAPKATMREFSHTNPHTGTAFGDEMAFSRGPAVAADGGRADAADGEQTMRDVDHEHPDDGTADANRVFERGRADDDAAADETVDDDAAETATDDETVDDETAETATDDETAADADDETAVAADENPTGGDETV